jgi:hypothetical protein
MSQADKLMHELSQNCGIDFNNTRRRLAVEIIEHALANAESGEPTLAQRGEAALAMTSSEAFGSQNPVIENTQESSDASGK